MVRMLAIAFVSTLWTGPGLGPAQADRDMLVIGVRWVMGTKLVGWRNIAIASDHMGRRIDNRAPPPPLSMQDLAYIADATDTRSLNKTEALVCPAENLKVCRLQGVDALVMGRIIDTEGSEGVVLMMWLVKSGEGTEYGSGLLRMQLARGQWRVVEVLASGGG
jgi:hypothetical protein